MRLVISLGRWGHRSVLFRRWWTVPTLRELGAPSFELGVDLVGSGRAEGTEGLDGVGDAKHLLDTGAELRMRSGEGVVGEIDQPPASLALAEGDESADDLVCGALGDAAQDQVFHQGGGVEEALVEPLGDLLGAERGAVDDNGGQLKAG